MVVNSVPIMYCAVLMTHIKIVKFAISFGDRVALLVNTHVSSRCDTSQSPQVVKAFCAFMRLIVIFLCPFMSFNVILLIFSSFSFFIFSF